MKSKITREASNKPVLLKVEAPGREPFEKALVLKADQVIRAEMKKLEETQPRKQKTLNKKPRSSSKKKKREKKKSKNWETNPFG